MEQTHAKGMGHRNWYDKSYKWLLIPPAIIFIISLVFLYNFYQKEGDVIYKDVSLTGGTTISVFDAKADMNKIAGELRKDFSDLSVREISDIQTGKHSGFSIETKENVEKVRPILEKLLGYKLTSENSSVEFSGSNLSAGFYQQLRNSLIAAFLLMSWVVFSIFGDSKKIKGLTLMLTALGLKLMLPQVGIIGAVATIALIGGFIYTMWQQPRNSKWNSGVLVLGILMFLCLFFYLQFWIILPIGIILIGFYTYYSVPSLAVISCAFADIIMTVAVVDYSKMILSTAGIVAFLMLIGYSVDTDILMTTRLLRKKEGSLNLRLFEAFKTGMTMTITAIASVWVSLLVIRGSSATLSQIFIILIIGLSFDILNTWVTNASLLKWYVEAKHLN